MECAALKRVRDDMGLTNVEIMVPFVRTLTEAERVTDLLGSNGLTTRRQRPADHHDVRGAVQRRAGRAVPRVFRRLLDRLQRPDAVTLGLDRDPGLVAEGFDERDPAVKALLTRAITACCERGKYVGICGQGPSDHADFARWLMEQGIESISLNPDTVVDTWRRLARPA